MDLPSEPLDVLVVGSGVAGLSAAVRLASLGGARVGVLTKGELAQSTTRWAQGGVAAVLPGDEDSTDRHLADTLKAGAGLCDRAAVRVLVDEGPARVTELIALGAVFDRLPSGDLARALEGGHSSPRILHAGGTATGAEVERALVTAVGEAAAALLEHWFAIDLIVEGGRCRGVTALDPEGRVVPVRADHVVLACGGAGQLFAVTTNPDEATGDGVAMALRAGVLVTDVEFVQFHPTALHHPVMPRPLLSEALRGHGALLRNEEGERFVDELQPRDVVSRAIAAELAHSSAEHVWLDCTGLADFAARFPTIHASLAVAGYDPEAEWLPVAPAAHYLSGGVATDLDGASVLPGLWAAGEVACSGVHGANRLASNSLLEGLVFASRIGDVLARGLPERRDPVPHRETGTVLASTARRSLQAAMTEGVGVLRSRDSMATTLGVLEAVGATTSSDPYTGSWETTNLHTVATVLTANAKMRRETRGSHWREDFPDTDDEHWHVRLVSVLDADGVLATTQEPVPVAHPQRTEEPV